MRCKRNRCIFASILVTDLQCLRIVTALPRQLGPRSYPEVVRSRIADIIHGAKKSGVDESAPPFLGQQLANGRDLGGGAHHEQAAVAGGTGILSPIKLSYGATGQVLPGFGKKSFQLFGPS